MACLIYRYAPRGVVNKTVFVIINIHQASDYTNQTVAVFLLCQRQTLERPSPAQANRLFPCGHEGPISYLVAPDSWSVGGRSLLASVPRRTSRTSHSWLVALRATLQHSAHQKRQLSLQQTDQTELSRHRGWSLFLCINHSWVGLR